MLMLNGVQIKALSIKQVWEIIFLQFDFILQIEIRFCQIKINHIYWFTGFA